MTEKQPGPPPAQPRENGAGPENDDGRRDLGPAQPRRIDRPERETEAIEERARGDRRR